MAEISKITLPSGNTYDIKDAVARQAIAGGITFVIAWDGNSTPVVGNIPAGVTVTYNSTDYTGTLTASASTKGSFYLVWISSEAGDHYSEYATIQEGTGSGATYFWEKIGDVKADLSGLVTSVTLNKGDGDNVLGEATTFTAASSSVSFSGGTNDKVLGVDTTFSMTQPTITVTPTTTNIKATASGTAVGADGTDTFVKSYPGATSKLVTTSLKGVSGTVGASEVSHTSKKLQTTSVPNVTGNTSATLTLAMGTGDNSETLIIGGTGFSSNTYTASNTTLGTAITAATGTLVATSTTTNVGDTLVDTVTETARTVATADSSATTVATGKVAASDTNGDSVMTGLGTASTASALTGVKVTTQPSVSLSTGATAGTGVISVATGITSATATNGSVTAGNNDEVTAITSVGTGTAAAQTITVGTNDKVSVAKYNDLSLTVTNS